MLLNMRFAYSVQVRAYLRKYKIFHDSDCPQLYVWKNFEVCRVPQALPWRASGRASKRKAIDASSLEMAITDQKKLATELVWMIELVTIRDPSRAEKIQYVEHSLMHIAGDHYAYNNQVLSRYISRSSPSEPCTQNFFAFFPLFLSCIPSKFQTSQGKWIL
jgi:hypothetical protein